MKSPAKNKKTNDIAEFIIRRDQKVDPNKINSINYHFVMRIINTMMQKSGVDTPNLSIGGKKEVVVAFIAGLIDYQLYSNIDIDLVKDEVE